jgi:hypothetical protein
MAVPHGWSGGCGKSRRPPGFDPRTVQPVASRYTDFATPTHNSYSYETVSLKYVFVITDKLMLQTGCGGQGGEAEDAEDPGDQAAGLQQDAGKIFF